jgi:hypothetical protein
MACRHRRIVVIGATGSGKSSFALRLARSLDVAFVELDALFWESDWTPTPPDIFRARRGGHVCHGVGGRGQLPSRPRHRVAAR